MKVCMNESLEKFRFIHAAYHGVQNSRLSNLKVQKKLPNQTKRRSLAESINLLRTYPFKRVSKLRKHNFRK